MVDGDLKMCQGKVVFLSAYHDYRTKKRASVHQLASGTKQLGYDVVFISLRYSLLSRFRGDSRLTLDARANRIETVDGVQCFLWKTPFHPFASQNPVLNGVMGMLFRPYAAWPNATFDRLIADADFVIVEASVAAVFLRRIRRRNPDARIIYYGTDRLDTIGAHPAVSRRLGRDASLVAHVALRSPKMAPDFAWAADRLYHAQFGIDPADFSEIGPSPYAKRPAAVSIGSMLFDASFFQAVAPAFPDMDFHIIGSGSDFESPPNVHVHSEMPFRETLPYIAHAAVGIAPYREAPGVDYLADTSLKLAQYEYLGIPAVCPHFATGGRKSRWGYDAGDPISMRQAFGDALEAGRGSVARSFPSWPEVARRVIHAVDYPETKIEV